MKTKVKMAALAAFALVAAQGLMADSVVKSLAGTWRVTGDGISDEVRLPGTLADAKLGRHMTAADWEKDTFRPSKGALTREYQYRGKAVYEREITLTEEEARYPLELVMERVMLHSELAIDDEALGSCDSLATEHVYPIPRRLTKPGRHTIRLTLDNSNLYNFSEWAHSYGPVMQSVWHGVVGEFALRIHNPLRQARVFASWPTNGKLVVEVPESFKAKPGDIRLWKFVELAEDSSLDVLSAKPSPYRKGFKLVELKLNREPEAWSEHHPNLYVLELRRDDPDFTHQIRFGFRSVSAHDHAIWINGYKWFMRGNLDCCHFPLTGAPDTTKEWWRETFRRLRDEDGVNTIRFHSWTPPKAAFDVADEMGIYLAVEAGIWQDRWMKTYLCGSGGEMDAFVQRELRAVLEARANSPAFISFAIGNELTGDFKKMGEWMADCKAFDPSRLYFASAHQYFVNGVMQRVTEVDDYHVIGGMWRGRRVPFTDWDYEPVYAGLKLPAVAHEVGQWPIYVDWEHELAKYTGVMRPYNLEHFRDVGEKAGTKSLWPRYCEVSAKLCRLMYKADVEGLMRTPSCTGLQLLSVQDFTGQFEAMIGWRDSFYDLKPSVKGMPPFRDVFNPMPHLARFEKYCWSVGETYKATLVVRNITEQPIPEGTEFGYSVAGVEGSLRLAKTINPGDVGVVGEVSLPLAKEMAGKKFMLKFGKNSWPFWVFEATGKQQEDGRAVSTKPPQTAASSMPPYQIIETSSFDEAVAALAKGGRVLYTGPSASCVKSNFKPVYWSTGHFRRAKGELSSLGYMVRDGHPALRGFPTEDWADWQWHNLVEGGFKHGIDRLPAGCGHIVQPVPDLHYSTSIGMLFELKVGEGRLMVCGLNLSDRKKPEVNAVRSSILSYMESGDFNPSAQIELEKFSDAFAPIIPEAKRRPPEFADAPVYIAAAVELEAEGRNMPWKPSLDMAELKQGSYKVSSPGHWGTWRDETGSFWHGKRLSVTLTGTAPVNGTLRIRFRDPNRLGRSGRGTCEGRPFTVPVHQDKKGGAWWLEVPVVNEDALDGKIEFSCEALTGPNLMIDRVVLTADK